MLSFYHYEARKNRALFISLLALFLFHLLRFMTSPNDGIVSRTLISLIIFVTSYLYFSFMFYNDGKLFERCYYFITIGLILNLIAVLLQKIGFDLGTSFYDGDDRYTGLFSNPNQLAITASTTFIYYIDKIEIHKRPLKIIFAIGMVGVCFILQLLAGSKTNIIVSFVIFIAFFIFSVTKKTIIHFLFGLIFLFISLFIIKESGILMDVNPRLFDILSVLSLDNVLDYRTVASRIEMWDYSWNAGVSYPYLGEGLNSDLPGPISHSHNMAIDYLRIFGPAGMVGIISFMYALVAYRIYIPDNQSGNQRAKVCKYSIFAYLLANMMSDSMGPQTVFFLAFFVSYLSVHSSMFTNLTTIKEVRKSNAIREMQ
ncbi:O-antigen ligase family protein [Moritella sp. 24]|uniref:O-antigen ligase family protein n=1 Tax=Moritella sp. 24 TaxID=2746230 RepID=UPI001BA4E184|nr:O-antigen ligase family protein [Moritella sp. 24]QUM75747.1 O-antigen ligase family protein [Moritella sp. 24]